MNTAFSAFSYFGSGDAHSSSTFLYLIQKALTFHPIIREILHIYYMKLVSGIQLLVRPVAKCEQGLRFPLPRQTSPEIR
jgi:hypothetical protein